MPASHNKVFRIERTMGLAGAQATAPAPAAQTPPPAAPAPRPARTEALDPAAHGDIMTALNEIRQMMAGGHEVNVLRERVAEAERLQTELQELNAAIERTKRELSSLHYSGPSAGRFQEAGSELDAVVNATEAATETILAAAERIDTDAASLSASAQGETERGMADDIAEQVVAIFEACNFQDITGQRITKVVRALQFVEDHVKRMMEIWGGEQDLKELAPEPEPPHSDKDLLNGPALEGDSSRASQDDIDALFD